MSTPCRLAAALVLAVAGSSIGPASAADWPTRPLRIIEPILDAMGIPHRLINEDADVAKIRPAIEDAYAASHPVALLIGRRPSAS